MGSGERQPQRPDGQIVPLAIKMAMRTIAFFMLAVASFLSAAEADPAGRQKPNYATPPSRDLPVKGASAGNSCAGYGPDFVKVEGTGTCVKVSGAVSVDAGAARH
jgi:hypothetical protein